ncbi:hypothetical protein [Nostoc sp. CENA543]|nr:hypothetical protein [Nostoc sp. CENA543]
MAVPPVVHQPLIARLGQAEVPGKERDFVLLLTLPTSLGRTPETLDF